MMEVKRKELIRLKKRLHKVSQPNFKLNMKNYLNKLKSKIRNETIKNRKAKNYKRVTGNTIDNIEKSGKPEALLKLHDKEYDLGVYL
jgi:hypothetical protein